MAELITNPQELAQHLLLAARAIAAQVPGYVFIPVAERRRLQLQANIPVVFLTSAAAALDASPALAAALGITGGDRIRNAIATRNALLPVSDELFIISRGVRHTLTVGMSDAATIGQQVYSMAKTFNRTADREVLIPHIENMRRALANRGGSTSSQAEPTPPATPQP